MVIGLSRFNTNKFDSQYNNKKAGDQMINNNPYFLKTNTSDSFVLSFKGQSKDIKSPDLTPEEFKSKVNEATAKVDSQNRAEIVSELTEVLDLFLQDKWTEKNQPGKKAIILNGLRKIMGEKGQGNIVMAQINPAPGDIEGNGKKIMSYIRAAETIGVDTVVFPELSLMGYPIHDAIDRFPFLVDQNVQWLKQIAKRTGKTKALVGFVEPRKSPPGVQARGKDYFNSVAILGDGKIQGIVRKSLLPAYGEFNDSRYNEPSPASGTHPANTFAKASWGIDSKPESGKLSEIHGHDYGIAICEDTWNDPDFFTRPLYERDPIAELMANKPEVLINCSSSPSRTRKEQLKHNMLSFIAQKYNVPYVYVNQVGAIDDCSFDGTSRVYDQKGNLVARAKAFNEQFMVVNPLRSEGKIYSLPKGLEKSLEEQKVFSLDYYNNDLDRTYQTIIQGIRDYFKKTGFQQAVLGLSGGLDSSVCAVLLADALGPENVFAFSMPSKITQADSKTDAEILAKNLGINFLEAPISGIVDAVNNELNSVFEKMQEKWVRRDKKKATTQGNVQARARAMLLWAASDEFGKTMPIATSDKSEIYLGYATINGDMSGRIAPIGDVLKTKVFALAHWMNENRAVKNTIPEAILEKKPGAELSIDPKTGKPLTAEDDNMPYEFLDEAIWRIENKHQSFNQLMKEPFLYEKNHKDSDKSVTKEQKEEWLNKFFRKMSFALYKWSIMPPAVIVEPKGVNKADYKQPLTSSRINWREESSQKIGHKLDEVK